MGVLTSKLATKAGKCIGLVSDPRRVMIAGTFGSGKTTVLYLLKLGEKVPAIPSIVNNVEDLHLKSGGFADTWLATDVGGRGQSRFMLREYAIRTCQGIIWVVDSAEDLEESRDELFDLLRKDSEGLPLLVLAHKQDLPGAVSADEVKAQLQLHSVTDRPWAIFPTSAEDLKGLRRAALWLKLADEDPAGASNVGSAWMERTDTEAGENEDSEQSRLQGCEKPIAVKGPAENLLPDLLTDSVSQKHGFAVAEHAETWSTATTTEPFE